MQIMKGLTKKSSKTKNSSNQNKKNRTSRKKSILFFSFFFFYFRNTVFNQKFLVNPVSELSRGPLSVTEGHTENLVSNIKLDGVGPVDNRPCTD